MALVSTPAIILQTFSYSDTSKILRLLTRQHGVQSVIAKGALRPKSRFGGILEPFTEGSATFFRRDLRDLQTLTGLDLIRSRQLLGSDLLRFGGASLLAELVLRTGSEESDPVLFDTIRRALDTVEEAPAAQLQSTILALTWSIVAQLGFAPALDECLHCRRTIAAAEEVRFDHTAGAVQCLECSEGLGGRTVPSQARAALASLIDGVPLPLDSTAPHWRLLARFLSHHVLDGQSLNSLVFLAETVDGKN
jgi:DNA repair protein RecO (recombination protein O)